MLTYRKPVECFGSDAVIVIREDGELEIEGYDIEYDIAVAAMGGDGESVCKKLVEKWSKSKTAAICELLAEDPVVPLSLAADTVSHAYMIFNESNQAAGRSQDADEHYIMDAISFTRNLVELKTHLPSDSDNFWDTYDPLEEDVKISRIEGKCFTQNSFESRKRHERAGWYAKHINIFDAAGYLSRAASKAIYVEQDKVPSSASVGSVLSHDELVEAVWYYAALAISEACLTIAFSTENPCNNAEINTRFYHATNWTVARFVHQMNRFEAAGEWK